MRNSEQSTSEEIQLRFAAELPIQTECSCDNQSTRTAHATAITLGTLHRSESHGYDAFFEFIPRTVKAMTTP
jgi:hypothetical protein